MTALLYLMLLLVVVLAVVLVQLWRRVQLLKRQADALRQGLDCVRVSLYGRVLPAGYEPRLHEPRLVVITDRPADAKTYGLMKAMGVKR